MAAPTAAPILAFSLVAATLVLTPGVGTAFLITTVVDHGRRAGYLTAAGMVLAASLHATVAAVGSTLLLRSFPGALSAIGLIGGAFIMLLGLRGIVRASRLRQSGAVERGPSVLGHAALSTGFLISLSNAPLPVFYFVVVPRYIPPGMSRPMGAALLSAIHLTMAGTWMIVLVTLVGRLAPLLRRPRVLFALQLASGLILTLLGAQAIVGAL